MSRGGRLAAVVAVVAVVGACSTGSVGKASGGRSVSPSGTASASPAAATGPCLASRVPPAPPGPASQVPLWTVASGMNQPDDLLWYQDQLYVGELGAGRIHVLAAGKPDSLLPAIIPKVEGMVFVNGTLYAGDQQNDRVDVVDGSSTRTLIQLRPVPGQDGVDNISAVGQQILVPDSPRGVLNWVDLQGRVTRTVGGFVRPTGVWPMPDGSVLVADEFGNSAVRLAPDGSKTYLARGLPIVDDIIADASGNVFVARPAAAGGAVDQLVDGSARAFISRMAAPQGLAFDNAGNLFVSESDAGRVDLAIRSFKLVPVGGTAAGAGAGASAVQALCVDLVRSQGFTGDVTFSGDSRLEIRKQPGSGSRGEVVAGSCTPNPCQLVARSGSLEDVLWIGGT